VRDELGKRKEERGMEDLASGIYVFGLIWLPGYMFYK
jgi:hypothetical protein